MTDPLLRSPADPRDIGEIAEQVLSDPMFQTDPSLLDRMTERFFTFIDELFGQALQSILGRPLLGWTIAGLAAVALGVAVWRWTRGVQRGRSIAAGVADPQGHSPDHYLKLAQQAEDNDDLRLALRRWYLAVVATLEEQGTVQPSSGRTIRELHDHLERLNHPLRGPISELGGRVETVIFAGQPATVADIDTARRVYQQLGARADAHR